MELDGGSKKGEGQKKEIGAVKSDVAKRRTVKALLRAMSLILKTRTTLLRTMMLREMSPYASLSGLRLLRPV